MRNNIYKMQLNESIMESGIAIRRVPGGWIYAQNSSSGFSSVFVPYNEEYNKK
tara:strand:- start:1487 stop:1645 length:159 start_codon:yes stop_codon:yes gene_type:complete